jgi:hypothetical protein
VQQYPLLQQIGLELLGQHSPLEQVVYPLPQEPESSKFNLLCKAEEWLENSNARKFAEHCARSS